MTNMRYANEVQKLQFKTNFKQLAGFPLQIEFLPILQLFSAILWKWIKGNYCDFSQRFESLTLYSAVCRLSPHSGF